jgi:hypothetical protein
MADFDSDEVREKLAQYAGLHEIAEVTTFRAYKRRRDEQTTSVTVEIFDHGAAAGDLRWFVRARDELGNQAACNPDQTLDLALLSTHWNELEGDGTPDQADSRTL